MLTNTSPGASRGTRKPSVSIGDERNAVDGGYRRTMIRYNRAARLKYNTRKPMSSYNILSKNNAHEAPRNCTPVDGAYDQGI